MIVDVSNEKFRKIFNDSMFNLPIRWDGKDYCKFLKKLFIEYCFNICNSKENCELNSYFNLNTKELRIKYACPEHNCFMQDIWNVCNYIHKAVKEYLKGFPSKAYSTFSKAMEILIKHPVKIYPKSGWGEAFDSGTDPLNLFRIVNVSENINYPRTRVFHTPYNLRTKVGTNRYSIAGFPSLYLGTSLDLCLEELNINPYENFSLCSRFQLIRNQFDNDVEIEVIELGIKPQDFLDNNETNEKHSSKRKIDYELLQNEKVRKAYLLWYPIIAANSFIRAYKHDPFAPEYIIPQLLMQWLRNWSNSKKLFGLRYFSCASERASELGFNYVFPTSGRNHNLATEYCKILVNSFKTTTPVFVHEFENIADCESYLLHLSPNNLDYIYK